MVPIHLLVVAHHPLVVPNHLVAVQPPHWPTTTPWVPPRRPHHPPLSQQEWSEELAQLATARVAGCLASPPPPPAPQLGWSETLLPVGAGGFVELLERWFAEGHRYDYGAARCTSNATCNHYTQVGQEGHEGHEGRWVGGWGASARDGAPSPAAGVGDVGAGGLRPAALRRDPGPQPSLRLRLPAGVRGWGCGVYVNGGGLGGVGGIFC